MNWSRFSQIAAAVQDAIHVIAGDAGERERLAGAGEDETVGGEGWDGAAAQGQLQPPVHRSDLDEAGGNEPHGGLREDPAQVGGPLGMVGPRLAAIDPIRVALAVDQEPLPGISPQGAIYVRPVERAVWEANILLRRGAEDGLAAGPTELAQPVGSHRLFLDDDDVERAQAEIPQHFGLGRDGYGLGACAEHGEHWGLGIHGSYLVFSNRYSARSKLAVGESAPSAAAHDVQEHLAA